MAFSDLCKISNAFKAVENETDQSERIMEENSMVRDLITKILDETGPSDLHGSTKIPDKPLNLGLPSAAYTKNDSNTTSYPPPSFNIFQDNFNFNDQNFNFNLQNDFPVTNGFNFTDTDVNSLLGIEDATDSVTPEQLNLLRLAAQEIGGAQFTSPNQKFDNYNFFEPNQRNSLPDTNMFANNYNRPNSLNLDTNYSSMDTNPYMSQRYPKFQDNQNTQDASEIMAYLNQMNISERPSNDAMLQNKMLPEINSHYSDEHFNKMADERNKMFNFNRNYQQMPPNKNFNDNNFYLNEIMKNMNGSEKNFPMGQNFDYQNQNQLPNSNNFKPNGFQNDYVQRQRDMGQMMPRDYQNGPINEQRGNFDGHNMQQAALMRQNQELARQMSLLMRNRPPPNQLNVDVSFLHDNPQFNLGLGTLLGPSPPVPPPVLPSPMLDLPLLAPFYAMRNMRTSHSSSAILHYRLDSCYEQWRQLERERKRTEARLALAYPGRAVSSSNSIPVPRLPPAPTRVDRLTVDMLREHTKVLTLMGKMETLRASVCVAQNKKPMKEESKITVLKRGQENVEKEKENVGLDPANFDPSTWREDVKNLAEIAPHSEVESAMLSWRSAVCGVQAARRRELAPDRHRQDPILSLAEAVGRLATVARRARCAMWCDLTLTVALAPPPTTQAATPTTTAATTATADPKPSQSSQSPKSTETNTSASNNNKAKPTDSNEEKSPEQSNATATSSSSPTKTEVKPSNNNNTNNNNNSKPANKTGEQQQQKPELTKNQRRNQNYSNNRHKIANRQQADFFKNQRYDTRFMHNRHPYYLATGPIN